MEQRWGMETMTQPAHVWREGDSWTTVESRQLPASFGILSSVGSLDPLDRGPCWGCHRAGG